MIIQASLKVLPNSYKSREENYKLVDETLRIIKSSELRSLIGTSETTVEGSRNDVMELIKKIQNYYYENNIEFSFFVNFEYNNDNFYIQDKQANIKKI